MNLGYSGMIDMDKEKISQFIEEYKALCEKHGLLLAPRRDSTSEMSIAVVEIGFYDTLDDNVAEIIATTFDLPPPNRV